MNPLPSASSVRRVRKTVWPVVSVVFLGVVLYPACGRKPRAADPAAAAEAARPVHCLGRILPGEKVLVLAAPSPSVVKELRVGRGDRVARGQTLAVFTSHDAAAAAARQAEAELRTVEILLDRARGPETLAEIAAREAVFQRTRSEHEKARIDRTRAETLLAAGQMTPSDFENADIALRRAFAAMEEADQRLVVLRTSRSAEIALAEQRLASARAALDRARAEAELGLLRAPVDGTVIDISAWPGEAVGGRGVLDLGETGRMMVEAEVYVSDIDRVAVGAAARVSGDGFAGEVAGRVTEIVGQVGANALYAEDPYSYADRRVVKVRIRLDGGDRVAALNNTQVNVMIVS